MRLLSSVLALTLSVSAALAGEVGALPPGSPAGVRQAQVSDSTILYGALGAGAIAGFIVALTSGSNSGPAVSAPTTTSIATAP
jgi:hypothetical protein